MNSPFASTSYPESRSAGHAALSAEADQDAHHEQNSLQALALQAGVAKRSGLFTRAGEQELAAVLMSPVMQWQREHWLQLLQPLNQQVLEAMVWLKAQSKDDACVARLRTHPGIGLLTSLCLAHTLQPVTRFRNARKVAAYAGFDPVERSSAEHKRFLGISKAGSRLLRHLMVEAANVAVRKDEDLKRFYQRLADRRGRPKAKVAVARKLLIRATSCCVMRSTMRNSVVEPSQLGLPV